MSVQSNYPKFMEYHVHKFYNKVRVCKMSNKGILTNGGSEWFLVVQNKLMKDMIKIKTLMCYIYGDSV